MIKANLTQPILVEEAERMIIYPGLPKEIQIYVAVGPAREVTIMLFREMEVIKWLTIL